MEFAIIRKASSHNETYLNSLKQEKKKNILGHKDFSSFYQFFSSSFSSKIHSANEFIFLVYYRETKIQFQANIRDNDILTDFSSLRKSRELQLFNNVFISWERFRLYEHLASLKIMS